jgi:hypothetical protein
MKPIELTEEQEDKLIVMCETLFTEYYFEFIRKELNANFTVDFLEITLKSEVDDVTKTVDYIQTPWFEFCILYLVIKLQDNLPSKLVYRNQPAYVNNIYGWEEGNKWTMYSEFFFHYPKNINIKHPIDYLYEEFKKLELL